MHDSTKFKYKVNFNQVKSGDMIAAHNTVNDNLYIFKVDEDYDYIDDVPGDITIYPDDDKWVFYSQTEPEVILPTERGVYVFPDWPNVGQGPIAQRGTDHWTMLYADGSTSLTPNDTMKAHVRSWGITKLVPQK